MSMGTTDSAEVRSIDAVAQLRSRALRLREIARAFIDDPLGRKLHEIAAVLDAEADNAGTGPQH